MKLLPTKKKLHDDYTLTTTVCLSVSSVQCNYSVVPDQFHFYKITKNITKKNRKLKIEFKKILT